MIREKDVMGDGTGWNGAGDGIRDRMGCDAGIESGTGWEAVRDGTASYIVGGMEARGGEGMGWETEWHRRRSRSRGMEWHTV